MKFRSRNTCSLHRYSARWGGLLSGRIHLIYAACYNENRCCLDCKPTDPFDETWNRRDPPRNKTGNWNTSYSFIIAWNCCDILWNTSNSLSPWNTSIYFNIAWSCFCGFRRRGASCLRTFDFGRNTSCPIFVGFRQNISGIMTNENLSGNFVI